MSIRDVLHGVRRWAAGYRARRRARLAAIRRTDEFLVEQANQAADDGVPYDTWRRSLPDIRRGGGGIMGGGGAG